MILEFVNTGAIGISKPRASGDDPDFFVIADQRLE